MILPVEGCLLGLYGICFCYCGSWCLDRLGLSDWFWWLEAKVHWLLGRLLHLLMLQRLLVLLL